MCGIAGVVSRGGTLDVEHQRRNVGRMLTAMTHRGPDDETIAVADERCIFGFRRLSIIDVEGGRQPIRSEDGRVLVIANGEVYNHHELRERLGGRHTLASHSDCEVLPHLYEEHGTSFVDHLNGMYGIALWDSAERKLLLVRDRLGVKPLYYYATKDAVIFASELKGLFAHPDVPVRFDWPHALELRHARLGLDHDALGAVDIAGDDHARVGAQVEVPEHVAGGQRGHQQLLGIPTRRITPE